MDLSRKRNHCDAHTRQPLKSMPYYRTPTIVRLSGFDSLQIPFMPVLLNGSCHCGTVRFSVESHTPVPYQLCVCAICRKVGGVGGSVNLGAEAKTLRITRGKERVSVYRAVLDRDAPTERIASSERNFCSLLGHAVAVRRDMVRALQRRAIAKRPDLLHPFASAIDSPPLEPPQAMVVVMLDSKPEYVRLPEGPKHVHEQYGPDSIDEWHKKHGKYVA